MNKEQLLSWAVKHVRVWPRTISQATPRVSDYGLRWHTGEHSIILCSDSFEAYRDEWEAARVACGVTTPSAPVSVMDVITAHSILEAAGGHMRDRAATYDKPEGERSMGATVEAFRAVTGHKLTEEQGWLFMSLLKAVRSQQGAYRADSHEDGCAYVALAGEAAARERGGAQ